MCNHLIHAVQKLGARRVDRSGEGIGGGKKGGGKEMCVLVKRKKSS